MRQEIDTGTLPRHSPTSKRDFSELQKTIQLEANRRGEQRKRHWYDKLSRLLAAGAIFLSGVETAAKLDEATSTAIWPVETAQFHEIDSVDGRVDAEVLVVALRGFNGRDADELTQAVQPIVEGVYGEGLTRFFSLEYASYGVDQRDIARKFDELVREIGPRKVVVFGQSMGGVVGLELLAQLNRDYGVGYRFENGNRLGESVILLDCTPLDSDDIRLGMRLGGGAMNLMAQMTGSVGGVVTRRAIELAAKHERWLSVEGSEGLLDPRDGDRLLEFGQVAVNLDYFDRFDKWFDRKFISGNGAASALTLSQYRMIGQFGAHAEEVFDAIGDSAQILQIKPANSADDTVVDGQSVTSRLVELQSRTGVRVESRSIAATKHASLSTYPDKYQGVISDILSES